MVEQDLKANGRASSDGVEGLFKHLSGFFEPDCLARNITADQVERYKSRRLAAQAKPATINRELAFLRRGFRLAVRRGRLAVRPDFSLLREDNARKGFITEKEMEAIRAAMPEDLRGLVTFFFYSGWRVGEALSLEWSRVDRDVGQVAVKAAGVPGPIPHDLRRSAARNMLQAGIPQRLAMALGGRKTSSVFHRYGIVDESMLRDALAKLSKTATPR